MRQWILQKRRFLPRWQSGTEKIPCLVLRYSQVFRQDQRTPRRSDRKKVKIVVSRVSVEHSVLELLLWFLSPLGKWCWEQPLQDSRSQWILHKIKVCSWCRLTHSNCYWNKCPTWFGDNRGLNLALYSVTKKLRQTKREKTVKTILFF